MNVKVISLVLVINLMEEVFRNYIVVFEEVKKNVKKD